MPVMSILTDGEGVWPDLPGLERDGQLIDAMGGDVRLTVALLRGGMQSGAPSVTLRLDLADGRVVLTETSLALLVLAAETLRQAAQG